MATEESCNDLTGFHADSHNRLAGGSAKAKERLQAVSSPCVKAGANIIRFPPVVHLTQSDLDVLDPRGQPVADGKVPDKTGDSLEVAEEALGWRPAGCDTLRILLNAVLTVVGEFHRLLDPWRALVVVVAVEGAGLLFQEQQEEGVHHLHLVLDELHVAADAAKQPCLVSEHGADAAQQRVEDALD
uniref:Uncharacterized protein n=1 Tax=Oryza rufipogon TaxID=4529 RepID=A0A0E0RBL5_ORYRU